MVLRVKASICALVGIAEILYLIQSPANSLGKTIEDNQSAWATAIQVEDPDGVPHVWLWLGPIPIIATISVINQQLEKTSSLSLSLSPFLSLSLSLKYINKS